MTLAKPIVEIRSTGRFLPDKVLTNKDLESMVDTSDQWITERTGIKERRIAEEGLLTAEMGASAARIALERGGYTPEDVDFLVVSTATPDRLLPSTACDIQALIGASNAVALDLSAACSGFIYGLSMAEGYLAAGRGKVALVISTEMMSRIIDWEDRSLCVLFGDGAGAVVLTASSDGERGIVSSHMKSDGKLAGLLHRPAGGVAMPLNPEVILAKSHLMQMAGREIFKSAVRSMADAAKHALEDANLCAEDVDLMIPHQANIRIIESTARYAGISMDRTFVNVDRYGNMSSASIPVALDEALEQGLIGPGANVLTVAFGAGLTWGSMVLRF
ncbi:MAG: beta-ketoacyl-ACP synthase III [Gemmatimonadota bacterium]